jgi:ABC-type sugar transport system permease subunit
LIRPKGGARESREADYHVRRGPLDNCVLQIFEVPYVIAQGGPRYSSTTTTCELWLEAFQYSRLGYASSVAFVLFTLIVVASLVQYRALDHVE